MSATERKILVALQQPLPKTRTPFDALAEQTGVQVEKLLGIVEKWQRQGLLRRFGAVADHFKAGPAAGAMVAWTVPQDSTEQVRQILAGFDGASHIYQRRACSNWPYNLYTMVHAADRKQLAETIERMSRACGIMEYRVLLTQKELKKTAPKYNEY